MLNYKSERVVSVQAWDALVREVYGRPYSFQQQEGCKPRGVFRLSVPAESDGDDAFERDSIPEEINGNEMGVSFEAWKARDPNAPVGGKTEKYFIELFWTRSFYPDVQMVANDLHAQGKLEAGDYLIEIDW